MIAIIIINDGNDVAESNFWNTIEDENTHFFMSFVPGEVLSCRILLSADDEAAVDEMKTARQTVIELGPSSRISGILFYNIIFDDGSGDPYAIRTTVNGADFHLSEDFDGKAVELSVWLPDADSSAEAKMSKARCVLRQKAVFRAVDDVDGVGAPDKQANSIDAIPFSWEDVVASGIIVDFSCLTTGVGRLGCMSNAKQHLDYFAEKLGRTVEDIIVEVLTKQIESSGGRCSSDGYGPIFLRAGDTVSGLHIRVAGIDRGGPAFLFCLIEDNEFSG